MMCSLAVLLVAGGTLLLAGCVSPEEQRAMDQQTCSGFGFSPGSVAFANCMMSTAQQREAQQAADNRAAQARQAQDAEARAAASAAAASASVPSSQNTDPSPPRNAKCVSTSTTDGDTTTTHEECHW